MRRALTLFEDQRLTMKAAMEMTRESLLSYGDGAPHWAIAWSGGKDSTTLLTLVIWLMESGQIERPERLTILYADTRLELLPLWLAAQEIMAALRERGIDVRTVLPPMDKRFLVYILGRGVPPPNNNTLRWCTRQIKVDPMREEVERISAGEEQILMLTGVRQGESAVRDGRIAMSCGLNGAECGQGWYQSALEGGRVATLAPLLHWRVCHVWDWLKTYAPSQEYGDWPTERLADAYGGDEAEEINARTGCVGCPLASKDTALDALIGVTAPGPGWRGRARSEGANWSYLAPLKGLRPLWRELREPCHRLRKPGGEQRQDGSLVENQHRMGPLTFEARRMALARVLAIQAAVNEAADRLGRPRIDILNAEEQARIETLIDAGTWPQRWSGDEPLATEPFEEDQEQMSFGLSEQ
jgi:DNA sulfur modification protein DndC